LLDAPAGELCRACHDVADEELIGAHLGADLGSFDCLSCHTPHGSGNEKLLAAVLHPPLLDGCDTCHEGSANQVMEDGDSALCLICHDDVGESAEQAEVPHPALEVAVCADCHNPHASAQASLVKSPGGGVCTGCHDDQAAGAGEIVHGVIDLLGCQACHEPHGSGNPKLLRLGGNELCLSCHDPSRLPEQEEPGVVSLLGRFDVSAATAKNIASLRLSPDGLQGHPVPGHRVLGTPTEEELKSRNVESTFEGEFSCLTCHDPHKGRSEDIFRWDAASSMELCLQCHPK
jgi:predicted CXXCH cytochrome family protein